MKVHVLVGVPGSGKSEYAKDYKNENVGNTVILSSDEYRVKMFGSKKSGNDGENSTKVFEEMHRDLKNMLTMLDWNENNTIIYDATNISRKRRRALYTNIKQWNKEAHVSIVYFQSPLNRLLEINHLRKSVDNGDSYVPELVVRRMYEQLQVPRLKVDCDSLIFHHTNLFDETMLGKLSDYPINRGIHNFPSEIWLASRDIMDDEMIHIFSEHDCAPFHLETIEEHIEMCIGNTFALNPFDWEMVDIAKFHDLGKSITKKMVEKDGKTKAVYMNHANVSANYYLSYLISSNRVSEASMDVVEAIHQHMNAHQGLGEKNIRHNRLTNRVIDLILRFAKIDSMSKVTGEEL